MTYPSDEAVMAAVREGHIDLLGILFERYHGKSFGLCYRMVRDRSLADDLVQEAFLRVLRYRGSFRAPSSFAAWLYKIVRNVCLDQIRSRQHEDRALRRLERDCVNPVSWEHEDERAAVVRAALRRLDENQRAILELKRIHGLTYAEIAERVGTTEGAARVRVHRAVKQLRTIVQTLEEEGV